jgi:hypothetical protein
MWQRINRHPLLLRESVGGTTAEKFVIDPEHVIIIRAAPGPDIEPQRSGFHLLKILGTDWHALWLKWPKRNGSVGGLSLLRGGCRRCKKATTKKDFATNRSIASWVAHPALKIVAVVTTVAAAILSDRC